MIPARYKSIRDRVVAGVDQTFAEVVELLFLDGNQTDSTRNNTSVEGVVRVGKFDTYTADGGSAKKFRQRLSSNDALLSVDASRHPSVSMLKQGDKVRLSTRSGQPIFTVKDRSMNGYTRAEFRISEA